jgi:predicted ATPase/serine/threonine protein kinase
LLCEVRALIHDSGDQGARPGGLAAPAIGSRFQLVRELGVGGVGVVYEAYDRETESVVALKTLRLGDAGALYRFKQEFRALADVQHPHLLRLGELFCEGGKWFFTMELVRGKNFHDYVRIDGGRRELDRTLVTNPSTASSERDPSLADGSPADASANVAGVRGYDEERLRSSARQLALAIAALHHAGRIHRDVKPSNVLVKDDGHLVLLDFGLIEESRSRELLNRGELLGTPGFMAPEQVADAHVGPEADWYAFGVMLFLALTGELPFRGSERLMIEAKCAHRAPPPTQVLADVPADLNELCQALLERDPKLRPSAREILARLGANPAEAVPLLPAAAPAEENAAPFVGRADELTTLSRALDRALAGGSELVIVQGEPGVGKSALVRQFIARKLLSDPSMVVLAGRCYEQESVPFKGFDTIIDSLSLYLRGLDAEAVEPLLNGGVRFLASLFPVLLRVPSVAQQVPADRAVDNPLALREQAFAQLRAILTAIAARVPLILFVDDLQWADKETVALTSAVFSGAGAPACVFVATLRSETNSISPRNYVDLAPLHQLGPRLVTLHGLSRDESRSLWTTMWRAEHRDLGGDGDDAFAALSDDVAGHPLFLCELARYHGPTQAGGKLATQLQQVLWERIAALEAPAQRFMEVVALAGIPVKHSVLAEAAELSPTEILHLLGALRTAQLIKLSRHGDDRLVEPYHDRIREAIVQQLRGDGGVTTARMRQLHLRIGRRLLEHTRDQELPSAVFDIVRHLNAAGALIEALAERRRLCELNLIAARQAKLATAYDSALDYIARAMELLGEDPWNSAYELCRDLHIEQMEAQYLAGHREAALARFADLLPRLRSEQERGDVYVSKVNLDTAHGQFREAIATAREGLALFGVRLPKKANTASVLAEYVALRWAQGRRSVPELIHLRDLDDAKLRSIMQLYIALSPSAFFIDTPLLTVCLMRISRTSIRHGVNDVSAYGLSGYGLVLTGAFSRHDEAYQFGQLALRLNERFANHRISAKLFMINGTYLTAWVRPWSEAIEQLKQAIETARKTGDIAYEAYSAATLSIISYCESAHVPTMHERFRACSAIAASRREKDMASAAAALVRYAAVLGELPGERFDLGEAGSDEQRFCESLSVEKTPLSLFYYYFLKAELCYLWGDIERAARLLEVSNGLTGPIFSVTTTVEHCLLRALVAARQYGEASFAGRAKLRASMAGYLRKLRGWAGACPHNFESQYLLAVAEQARALGKAEAGARFEEAIAAARRHRAVKREAMALELAARFYREQGATEQAEAHLSEAVDAHRRWGAKARVAALRPDAAVEVVASAAGSGN